MQRKDAARQNVIIRVKDGNPAALAATLRAQGETVGRVHPGIGAIAASLTVNQIRALTEHDSVVSISTDAVVLADQTTTSTYTVRGTLGLPVQSPGGNRIGVAVIDSGVEPGPEFGDRIVAFYDFTQGGIAAARERRVRPRHARRRPDRRRRHAESEAIPRRRP